jgi:hypothetical protein
MTTTSKFTISIGEGGNHRVSIPYVEPIIEGTSVRVYTTTEVPIEEVRLVVSLGVSEEANRILSRYL